MGVAFFILLLEINSCINELKFNEKLKQIKYCSFSKQSKKKKKKKKNLHLEYRRELIY